MASCHKFVSIGISSFLSLPPVIASGYVDAVINVDILGGGGNPTNPILGNIILSNIRNTSAPLISPPITQTISINDSTQFNQNYAAKLYYTGQTLIQLPISYSLLVGDCSYVDSCVIEIDTTIGNVGDCVKTFAAGCTDINYAEYDPFATVDDGSCSTLRTIYGCNNPLAYNFNPDALYNDGTCIFISGCTNPLATNYEPLAVVEDGSCECGDINVELDLFSGTPICFSGDCRYFIEFDLLTKIDCKSLLNYFQNTRDGETIVEIFDNLRINAVTLEGFYSGETVYVSGCTEYFTGNTYSTGDTIYSGDTLTGSTFFTGDVFTWVENQKENVFDFNFNTIPHGVILDGDMSFSGECQTLMELLAIELSGVTGSCLPYPIENFDANWLKYTFEISPTLQNNPIRFLLNFENFRFKTCIYLDNIRVFRVCEDIRTDCIVLPEVFGFELERFVDNKKSWYVKDIRSSVDYTYTDDNLILNTKEADIRVNVSKYIMKDILAYFEAFKNELNDYYLQDLSEDVIIHNLIDAKNRQFIRAYARYDYLIYRYLVEYGCPSSKKLWYDYIFKIIDLLGSSWYEVLTQFIPETTIWGEYAYHISNFLLHQSKHRYKRYNLVRTDVRNCGAVINLNCEYVSDVCFSAPPTIDDTLSIGSTTICISPPTGNTACYGVFTGDLLYTGKIIEYEETSGQTIIHNLIGYDDYLCFSGESLGCTDPMAVNYNPNAIVDDGSCQYCDDFVVYGCTYSGALNYNPNATVDDGSCIFSSTSGLEAVCTVGRQFKVQISVERVGSVFNCQVYLYSPTGYNGAVTGSYKLFNLQNNELINLRPNIYQTSSTPVDLQPYISVGFSSLTPTPVTNNDDMWNFTVPVGQWLSTGTQDIVVTLLDDSYCLYEAIATITLPTDGNNFTITEILIQYP